MLTFTLSFISVFLFLAGIFRIEAWNAWSRLNPDAASLLFSGKTHIQSLAHMLTRNPPDRHSDLWK